MSKIDFKKQYKELYFPSAKQVSVVDIPLFTYIMIDGQGAPDGKEAMEAFEVLFPVAYKLKFIAKKRGKDYVVMPLEGLWWAEDMDDFVANRRNRWQWTYMIMQPGFITQNDFEQAVEEVKAKKELASINNVRLEQLHEGQSAQLMHLGPFSEEGSNIQKIHQHIESLGGTFDGHTQKHHEIYLSDLRKVAPEKMKTVLRQPFSA